MVSAIRSMSVASRPRPMMFGMMSSMEPNDGFAWTQADGKPVLVCRPFERAAQHLYTARQWALGIPTAPEADAWAEVARAVGVDGDRLVRVSQVHGAAVHKVQGGDGSGSGRQA